MENSITRNEPGKGSIKLEFAFGEILTITDFYHVPEVKKDLVFGGILNTFGFKLVPNSNKFMLSKEDLFVVKEFMYDARFKLNVKNISTNFIYLVVDSLSLWHSCKGNNWGLYDMSSLN